MYCPISIDTSIQYHFSIPTPPKVLRKRRKEEEEKKKKYGCFPKVWIWMVTKLPILSIDMHQRNKMSCLIWRMHWLVIFTHTNCIIIQYFWLFYYQFSIQIYSIDFYYLYYLQKASPDHIFKILVQLLLTVSNPKNLANISKCLFTHFYSFV